MAARVRSDDATIMSSAKRKSVIQSEDNTGIPEKKTRSTITAANPTTDLGSSSSNSDFSTIPSLLAPFLDIDSLFASVALVDKSCYAICLKLLQGHAKEKHPVLLSLSTATGRDDSEKETTNSNNKDVPLLTYGRYKQFLAPDKIQYHPFRGSVTVFPNKDGEYVPPRNEDDYDLLLEIYQSSSSSGQEKVIGYCVKKLDDYRFDWAEVSFAIPHFVVLDHWSQGRHRNIRSWIRLVLVSRTDGKMTTIFHKAYLSRWCYESTSGGPTVRIDKKLSPEIHVGVEISFERKTTKGEFKTSRNIRVFDKATRCWKKDNDKTNVKVTFAYTKDLERDYETDQVNDPNTIFHCVLLEKFNMWKKKGLFG